MIPLSLAVAAVLALTHVLTPLLRVLDAVPRSRLLSAAGGVSVAYVFVHLLPELAEGQEHLRQDVPWLERHVYLIALASFAGFYGLERVARLSRADRPDDDTHHDPDEAGTPPPLFWLHTASFAIYNIVIGYLLLHRDGQGLGGLLWFGLAMALHFVVNDHGLHDHHRHRYDRFGRWVLAAAVLVGWAASLAFDVSEAAVGAILAAVAGGVILNVIKEELPEERKSRWWAFAAGAAAYAALLLLV